MFKNLFSKDTKQVAPAQPAQREYKPTKKKKNTYVVTLNTMTAPGMFKLCSQTPLAVIKINGVETETSHSGFINCHQFANPGASEIEVLYRRAPEWRIVYGEKAVSTIVEYLDKQSGTPVLVLYPNGRAQSLVSGEDENRVISTRLNHASRRDFIRQYNRISEHVGIVNQLIAARNQAMKQAPEYGTERYAKFVEELNRTQIERAKQIIAQRQK